MAKYCIPKKAAVAATRTEKTAVRRLFFIIASPVKTIAAAMCFFAFNHTCLKKEGLFLRQGLCVTSNRGV